MEGRIIGLVLVSFGIGLAFARLFKWWGYIAAAVIIAVGIYLLLKGRC